MGCHCCDVCLSHCNCDTPRKVILFDAVQEGHLDSVETNCRERKVSAAQKQQLHSKLNDYRKRLLPRNTNDFLPVGSLTTLFEFDFYQISQIISNCHRLFTLEDITKYVELWRHTHANNVFLILADTFRDMEDLPSDALLTESDFMDMEVVTEDWEIIRDDSELYDESRLENDDSNNDFSVDDSATESYTNENNISDILRPIIDGVMMDTSDF